MRIFFSLAPHFMKAADYEASVRKMARDFDLEPVFAHQAPSGADATEWLAASLGECQYAFFDFTGLNGGVLFAYGVASQSDDVTAIALVDIVEHQKSKAYAGPLCSSLLTQALPFNDASDFQRKAHLFLEQKLGVARLLSKADVAHIKDTIKKKRPIHMRQLSKALGKPMPEVQAVVYDLVRNGSVRKIGDKRWAQYEA